ncbi:hypothetical protein C5C94_07965 [Rathayibacter sp. AY1C3]|nr:hypothetical protein C5B92_15205 [Rathayibacter sp. AY1A4]PPG79906.1 hypothetical protein C5C52_11370 [Rathayibacter sp. AY1E5]PPH31655.1 hypothetical protein C5C94_07965 [Rathayibacter sp. AY1C3]PPH65460.1 hypothetical protein C5D25_04100 [Rathayibacter sp. AY1D7]PPI29353.1 hypothetical protein C5D66_11370 [Rathayibacter sp. AY1B4]
MEHAAILDLMTDDVWPQVVTGAFTSSAALLGFFLAGLNEARRDGRSAVRERSARAEERRSAALQNQHQFQLDTLLALQDAVQRMARLAGRTMHFDHMEAREGRYSLLPSEYDADMTTNDLDVIRLRNRLLDDELRGAVEKFASAAAAATRPPVFYRGLDEGERERKASDLIQDFESDYKLVMDQLGQTLRAELAWVPTYPGH